VLKFLRKSHVCGVVSSLMILWMFCTPADGESHGTSNSGQGSGSASSSLDKPLSPREAAVKTMNELRRFNSDGLLELSRGLTNRTSLTPEEFNGFIDGLDSFHDEPSINIQIKESLKKLFPQLGDDAKKDLEKILAGMIDENIGAEGANTALLKAKKLLEGIKEESEEEEEEKPKSKIDQALEDIKKLQDQLNKFLDEEKDPHEKDPKEKLKDLIDDLKDKKDDGEGEGSGGGDQGGGGDKGGGSSGGGGSNSGGSGKDPMSKNKDDKKKDEPKNNAKNPKSSSKDNKKEDKKPEFSSKEKTSEKDDDEEEEKKDDTELDEDLLNNIPEGPPERPEQGFGSSSTPGVIPSAQQDSMSGFGGNSSSPGSVVSGSSGGGSGPSFSGSGPFNSLGTSTGARPRRSFNYVRTGPKDFGKGGSSGDDGSGSYSDASYSQKTEKQPAAVSLNLGNGQRTPASNERGIFSKSPLQKVCSGSSASEVSLCAKKNSWRDKNTKPVIAGLGNWL